MAVKMRPPDGADVKRVHVGLRTYVPGKAGTWTIDDNDADDLRRIGWQNASASDEAKADSPADVPAPEA